MVLRAVWLAARDDVRLAGADDVLLAVDEKRQRPSRHLPHLLVFVTVFGNRRSRLDVEMLAAHRVAHTQLCEVDTVDHLDCLAVGWGTCVHTTSHRRRPPKRYPVRRFLSEGDERPDMYAVVGCNNCSSLWVVEGHPDSTSCPRCGKRHQFSKLKQFVTTDDPAEAKQARAALLAKRQDQGEAFADLDHFSTMERQVERSGIDDETYLEGSGLDADTVTEAGERATEGRGHAGSRQEIVRTAIREQDDPTEADVVAHASEHGVPEATTRKLLQKLVRAGEASESGGTYRLL